MIETWVYKKKFRFLEMVKEKVNIKDFFVIFTLIYNWISKVTILAIIDYEKVNDVIKVVQKMGKRNWNYTVVKLTLHMKVDLGLKMCIINPRATTNKVLRRSINKQSTVQIK